MTTSTLINEISSLSEATNNKINQRRAMITRDLNKIEKTISNINAKITSQQDTINSLRSKLLDKSLAGAKADGPQLAKILADKEKLQLALATARKEQERLVSQNSELQGKLGQLQSEFEESNSDNLEKLNQVKATLKMLTTSLDAEAQTLGAKLDEVNKGLETALEDPVLTVSDQSIPVEINTQPPAEEEEEEEEEEIDVEEEEPEPELDTDDDDGDGDPIDLEEEEPEIDIDEEEDEDDGDVVVEDDGDVVAAPSAAPPSNEFGEDTEMRIIDSDDDEF